MGPMSQTENRHENWIMDALESRDRVYSLPPPQLCEGDDPFMPVLVNPEAAMVLL